MMTGIAIVTIHAPSVNFVWITSSATSPVAAQPSPFTSARRL